MLATNIYCQTFAPVGATWYYDEGFAFSGDISFMKFVSEKDTLIEGKLCQKIVKYRRSGCIDSRDIEFLSSVDDTIYFFNPVVNKFEILYNFDANKGDKWCVTVKDEEYELDTIEIRVDSIYYTNINQVELKSMIVTNNLINERSLENSFTSVIVERIGDLNYMFNHPFLENIACDGN